MWIRTGITTYIYTAQGKVVIHHHTWTGEHVDGQLVAVAADYWTCTISTDKYIYRSQTKAATALQAFKEAKADYRKYQPSFEGN